MSSEILKGLEPSAWRAHHDEPMLFPTFDEAAMYCDEEEPPEPLYAATAINAWIVELVQQRDELLAALEFYTNPNVYEPDSIGRNNDITFVARAAIAKVRE